MKKVAGRKPSVNGQNVVVRRASARSRSAADLLFANPVPIEQLKTDRHANCQRTIPPRSIVSGGR